VLPNGLTVLLNERTNLPVVSARLVVRTGSGANPVDKPGLANFTAEMLDEGAGSRSALQMADQVAQHRQRDADALERPGVELAVALRYHHGLAIKETGKLPALEDAPGSYVKVRAEA
jgi:hypothetical protein